MRGVAADHGLEDVRVADLLGAANHLLGLEAVHHSLHRGVGGATALRKASWISRMEQVPRVHGASMMFNSSLLSLAEGMLRACASCNGPQALA